MVKFGEIDQPDFRNQYKVIATEDSLKNYMCGEKIDRMQQNLRVQHSHMSTNSLIFTMPMSSFSGERIRFSANSSGRNWIST